MKKSKSCAVMATVQRCRSRRSSVSPAVADRNTLVEIRASVAAITLTDQMIEYIVDVIRGTREHTSLEVGASTRAANMLASAARAYAVLQGRDFVIPDDVKALALPALRHRLIDHCLSRDRGDHDGPDRSPDDRENERSTMMRPTRRGCPPVQHAAAVAVAAGVRTRSVVFALDLSTLVLLAIATDGLFAYPRSRCAWSCSSRSGVRRRACGGPLDRDRDGRTPAWFEVALIWRRRAARTRANPFWMAGAAHRETVSIVPRRRGILESARCGCAGTDRSD